MNDAVKWTLAGVLVLGLAVGGELFWVHHRNQEDQTVVAKNDGYKSDPDDLVFLKQEHPMSFKDAKSLKGRTLWISAGDQVNFYPYNGHAVDYAHTLGLLRSPDRIVVKDAVEQAEPKSVVNRIPAGDKQVLVVFTMPGSKSDPAEEYAAPVGTKQGADYTFVTDQIFFYDDPHQLFSYWGPDIWKAIDEHRATVGMTEREAQTALGQVSSPGEGSIGNRMVVFDNQGHPVRVTFANGKATAVTPE